MKPARESAVAGSFYSGDANELSSDVTIALSKAKNYPEVDVNAIITPHAGYVFSADVAANAYKTLHKKYKNIFLLGSSHHVNFDGVSLYNQGNYKTPLGEVEVNTEIVDKLIGENDFISYKEEAHSKEHTLEVQLPFLQTIYKNDLRIVPIIMATSELATIQKLSHALKPYFNDENLFVISTDLSHYPSYEDAKRLDANILNALSTNSTQTLINALIENADSKSLNLQTSACGWSSLLTLLYLTQDQAYTYELLDYKNSGDSRYGEKDRVVGYGAMRIYKESQEFTLSTQEKEKLKEIAKAALYEAVVHEQRLQVDPKELSKNLLKPLGAFVTLNLHSHLRGCIGRFEPTDPLYKTVIEMAISASRHDNRFQPVQADELADIEIEISVLTPRKRVDSLDEVVVGRDGIYVEYGAKNGTYLPKVATDLGWNKEQFFQSCCQEKANIEKEYCKDAKLYTYQAIVF